MISSFRVTFQEWLGHVLQADVFISQPETMELPSRLREEAIGWLTEMKDVRFVHSGEERTYRFDDTLWKAMVLCHDSGLLFTGATGALGHDARQAHRDALFVDFRQELRPGMHRLREGTFSQ